MFADYCKDAKNSTEVIEAPTEAVGVPTEVSTEFLRVPTQVTDSDFPEEYPENEHKEEDKGLCINIQCDVQVYLMLILMQAKIKLLHCKNLMTRKQLCTYVYAYSLCYCVLNHSEAVKQYLLDVSLN